MLHPRGGAAAPTRVGYLDRGVLKVIGIDLPDYLLIIHAMPHRFGGRDGTPKQRTRRRTLVNGDKTSLS